mmetsp:Transcript_33784/g.41767  ORF Transcript_33784/g.41767 Transcript_33784/m.41767 type:complete len:337 (+) Transcript_33784:557-1567(+)
MAEAHEHLLAVLNILNELGDVLDIADTVEHAKHSLICTTVAGTVEGGDGAGKRGVHIGLRGGHVADGGRGAVQLVLCVQDEQHFDGAHDLRVRSVVGVRGRGIHHVEEVLDVAKVLLRGDDRLADAMSVAGSSDGGGTAHDAVDVLVALLTRLVDVGTDVGRVSLGVERGKGSHAGRHHSHRVGVVAESLDEWLETLMIGGVLEHLLGEASELLRGGELTVDEEEGGLEEVGSLSELLDGVATVLEDALLTVDERDAGDAVDGVHVSGVVGASHGTGRALNLGEVGGVDGTILDDELVALASTVVNDRERVLGEAVGGVRRELRVNLRKTVHFDGS